MKVPSILASCKLTYLSLGLCLTLIACGESGGSENSTDQDNGAATYGAENATDSDTVQVNDADDNEVIPDHQEPISTAHEPEPEPEVVDSIADDPEENNPEQQAENGFIAKGILHAAQVNSPIAQDTFPSPSNIIPYVESITLTWAPPSHRENGDDLLFSEIGGYEIAFRKSTKRRYKSYLIDNPDTTHLIMENLTEGTYEVMIAVFDTNGIFGDYSTPTYILITQSL
jgi:hypothetical protein